MKELLNYLFEYKSLSKLQAKEVLKDIAESKYNSGQLAAFLTVYMMRSITVDELEGFRDALLEIALPVDLSAYDPIDLCGTGGDNKNTFNISTLSAFVVAGAGIKVAKHGNYGVSSICGSSTLMEYFDFKFPTEEGALKIQMEKAGICFLHAPLFHPAMKKIGPVRKALGVKTFFNMLGPMVNPCSPQKQIIGVFSLELARLYSYLYQKTNKHYIILHSLDAYDEISLTGPFKIITRKKEQLLNPNELGLNLVRADEIEGGATPQESAEIFIKILNGMGTKPQNSVVVANAGMGILCAKPESSIADCIAMADESLKSGKALKSFNKILAS